MNSNIDFQSVCLGTILYSSTEIIDFSWQLYFFLVNFKSEIWQIYVIRRHHCQSTRGSCLPLLIFSYKGISILYYSMSLQYKIDSKCFKMTSDYAMISNWPTYDNAWDKTHGPSSSRLVFLFKLCSEHVTFVQISILQNTNHIAKQYHNSVLKLARGNKSNKWTFSVVRYQKMFLDFSISIT